MFPVAAQPFRKRRCPGDETSDLGTVMSELPETMEEQLACDDARATRRGAERLLPSCKKKTKGQCGFLLKTRERTFELHANSPADAAHWIQGLNAARDIGRGSQSREAPPDLQEKCEPTHLESENERCRRSGFEMLPNSVGPADEDSEAADENEEEDEEESQRQTAEQRQKQEEEDRRRHAEAQEAIEVERRAKQEEEAQRKSREEIDRQREKAMAREKEGLEQQSQELDEDCERRKRRGNPGKR
eukprot:TRINITY_DN65252_c0_g1_i2.p1 TRINITY_DN65252_c0_g1~~TRINITY_DN65252_c0_g1_i2.p1  ORF type:complete len:245 (+),score=70.49 TRINITY_DN65252_c0_g1_i2:2-736(+)